MIGLEFLRHGNRFAARIRRRYFSAERISTAGNTSAFAGYMGNKYKLFPFIFCAFPGASAVWHTLEEPTMLPFSKSGVACNL